MPPSVQLLVILVGLVAFWFFLMRPARAQQRRVQELQTSLEVGQEVVLSAGIFGTIRALDDARVELEIAPGTVISVARQVVVRRADALDPAPETTAEPAPDATLDRAPGPAPTDPATDRGAND